jgi:hypothetical protein
MKRNLIVACLAWAALAPAALAQDPPAAPIIAPPPGQQELCGVFVRQPASVSYIPVEGFSILTAQTPLARPSGQPYVDAVICDRPSIYLGANDYRVLTDLSVPLFLRSGPRLATLEVHEGALRLRFIRGQPTAEEAQALSAALDQAQTAAAAQRRS